MSIPQIALLHDSWRNTQLNAVSSEIKADDDASLYRLFGYSLFAAICHQEQSVFGHLHKCYSFLTRAKLLRKLRRLEKLLETDKAILPAVAYQDRMSFSHHKLMVFNSNKVMVKPS